MAKMVEFALDDSEHHRLANLCGPLDQNIRQIAQAFDTRIQRRGGLFSIDGPAAPARATAAALKHFSSLATQALSVDDIQLGLVELQSARARPKAGARRPAAAKPAPAAPASVPEIPTRSAPAHAGSDVRAEDGATSQATSPDATSPAPPAVSAPGDQSPVLHTRRADLQGRTPRQREYLRNILSHDVTFGTGPAGTGKTYLAVACAVDALERDAVKRIVLTRPAVEAGERLGFLPGDLAQKVDPYLRPLYDALYDLLGFDRTARMFEKQAIEIAPLAYMRGRTLNHAFIILDEAQNTTPEQMKMFLTRMGFGSRAVVTGDITQVDLPRAQTSGLHEARRILQSVRGIAFTEFDSSDVVRHPLVARIVDAYERDARNA
jgi:phosphate starvation-inducible PhoH-like protein